MAFAIALGIAQKAAPNDFVIGTSGCRHLRRVQNSRSTGLVLPFTGRAARVVSAEPEDAQDGPSARSSAAAGGELVMHGDARLRAVVGRYVGLVWRVLRRSGLAAADAEDASQDVFWIFAQRERDVPAPAERAFLVATALRVASSCRRSKWRRSATELVDDAYISDATEPDQAVERRRALALLDLALAALDASEREVFILSELEQMSRVEVAEALGLPEGTVASRLRRAKESVASNVRRQRSGLWRKP